jgi:hypothetical protein
MYYNSSRCNIFFLIVDCVEAVANTSTCFDDSDFSGTAACQSK